MAMLKIVIPDGSMKNRIVDLFERAGIPILVERPRTCKGIIPNAGWISEVAFQRPQEIPAYLKDGNFDIAIVGEDWIAECSCEFPVLLEMAIGRSANQAVRIVLAAKQDREFQSVSELPENGIIYTEYPNLTRQFLQKNGRTDIDVRTSYGNTELKTDFGADAIVDITESGTSLAENGLEIIETIMFSNTVVVTNKTALENPEKKKLMEFFASLIKGAYQAEGYIMITANVPDNKRNKAAQIMGGLKGPTYSPVIKAEGWSALQAIAPKEKRLEIIQNLYEIGVTDIIVTPNITFIMT